MKYLIPLLILLCSCVSSKDIIDPQLSGKIPKDAERIIVDTEMTSDSLFLHVQRELIREGFRIEDANKDLLTVSTGGLEIGQSTFTRYTLYIEGSRLYGRADWQAGMQANIMATAASGINVERAWEPAKWSDGRPQRAFASLVSFMNKLSDSIHYE